MPLFRNREAPRGSYWKHVNWNQFAEEKDSFEIADMDTPEGGLQKAKVIKYTEVKPGQEFPTAKRGQGQLFRTQVWPKGFTPERQRLVKKHVNKVLNVDSHAEEEIPGSGTAKSEPQLRAQALNAIARSTMPTEDIKRLNKTSVHLGEELDGIGGYMDPNKFPYPEIHIGRPKSDVTDSVQDVIEDSLLLHEIGHAVDLKTNENRFFNNIRSGYHSGMQGNPVHEGDAMGYQLAHFRTTRNQRRRAFQLANREQRPVSTHGYKAHQWEDDGTDDNRGLNAESSFKTARLKTYRQEKGLTLHPLQEQRSDAPSYRQDKLPGM